MISGRGAEPEVVSRGGNFLAGIGARWIKGFCMNLR
jgi:hypothetical protein